MVVLDGVYGYPVTIEMLPRGHNSGGGHQCLKMISVGSITKLLH